MEAHKHHTLILINDFSLIAKKRWHEPIIWRHYPPFHHHWVVHRCRRRRPFTSSTSDKEASDVYRMPTECSLAASLHVAIVSGVGCDPPSSMSSSLSLLRCDLHCCPSPVSARCRPRTCPSTFLLSPPLSTSPSPSSARCQSWPVDHSLSASSRVA